MNDTDTRSDAQELTTEERLTHELDMVDGYIEHVWREVFGPTRPMPTPETSYCVGPRRTALKRIMGACSRVEWKWKQVEAALPDGVVLDESCPGRGECHGSLSWCEVCGDVRRTCASADACDEHNEAALTRRGLS